MNDLLVIIKLTIETLSVFVPWFILRNFSFYASYEHFIFVIFYIGNHNSRTWELKYRRKSSDNVLTSSLIFIIG